jgi:uncharacterized membrane protein
MRFILTPLALLSLLLSGAIFGFFYAWVCSTMWGLDMTDPNTAIKAMQAMNASVRNAIFAPAFFGTPVVLLATALVARLAGAHRAALWFGAGGVTYLFGGLVLTIMVNVPMNEALAQVAIPLTPDAAADIWASYSAPWQRWNIARTIMSGVALLLTGLGVMSVSSAYSAPRQD